ncbi:LysM peptidoglycan-binding domain-containing protein [Marinoscillum sp. MHG1-6]|uniref:LysM peptidoglycan-binding domain-containing protein n=1 Tax=Marinoscillum sp. MHG1-6 TaxID=2959627 RepID=UPI0021579061|nr:LysM peptidoglycan-binding domain-containing protein [Marinoscillum sp. MHG1-6]
MELRYSFSLVVLLATFFTSLYGYDSLRMENRNGEQVIIHQVDQGETLYALSKRYGAVLSAIVSANNIENNNISLGQLLVIPTGRLASEKSNTEVKPAKSSSTKTHIVKSKETLYSISKMYGVSVSDLKSWNKLKGNSLDIGQELLVEKGGSKNISPNTKTEKEEKETTSIAAKESKPGFTEYYVQTGDRLETIAKKYDVHPDSIIIWNELPNTYLAIGQMLLIRGNLDKKAQSIPEMVETTNYGKKRRVEDVSGFVKIYEEGVAKSIEGVIDTDKYLAMHRTLKVGTMVEVRNLMNNKKIFVRIVGKLPDTGLNENTLIRLTPICFERLGVIDPQTRVEISYYEE